MNKISEEIAKEVRCFKQDLLDTKGQKLDIKNPEHKRIVGNIVANEKAYRKHVANRCPCLGKPLNECDCEFDEDTTGLVGCTTCPLCGAWDYEIDEMGNCSICGNTVDNI